LGLPPNGCGLEFPAWWTPRTPIQPLSFFFFVRLKIYFFFVPPLFNLMEPPLFQDFVPNVKTPLPFPLFSHERAPRQQPTSEQFTKPLGTLLSSLSLLPFVPCVIHSLSPFFYLCAISPISPSPFPDYFSLSDLFLFPGFKIPYLAFLTSLLPLFTHYP